MNATKIALLALALAIGTAARDLPVPPGKGWQHAETGLILPATLDGLPRTKLGDTTTNEHDVDAEFATPDESVVATIYLYHPALDDVTMWFDRARIQIEDRDVYGGVEASTAEPIAFVPPGASGAPTALRQSFRPTRNYKSTALAVVPLGEWLVTVRLSATALDVAALDTRMTRILSAIRWPSPLPPAPALRPIAACATALQFEKAKVVKTDGGDMLMSLLMGTRANDPKVKKTEEKPVTWCRDPATTRAAGIYRSTGNDKGYLIALQDAGRTMGVWPSLGAQLGTKGAAAYSVTLNDVDQRTIDYPSFDGLPSPDRVIALLAGPARGSSSRDGKGKTAIIIDPKAL